MFALHFDSIQESFLTLFGRNVFDLPLLVSEPLENVPPPLPWVADLVERHARLVGMSADDFGSYMVAGFVEHRNQVVRKLNVLVTPLPDGWMRRQTEMHDFVHAYRAMTPVQRVEYAEHRQAIDDRRNQLAKMEQLWRRFAIAYSVYDDEAAASLRDV